MHRHKIGFSDEVGREDLVGIETKMRHRHRARLLRVVDEVALRLSTGEIADDLGRLLVRTDGAIRAEAVEHCL